MWRPIRTDGNMDTCTKSSNKMPICLILTADNIFRSKFAICNSRVHHVIPLEEVSPVLWMWRYASMFWFEIFVLKLSLLYDMNFYSVIFWMFLWDLCQWYAVSPQGDHFHSIDSQVKSIAYSCTRSLREQDGKYITNQINSSAQYVDTATTLLPCNRAPATNGKSTNMTSQTHVNVSTKHADTTAVQHTQHHGNTAMILRSFKMNNVEYICTQSVS